MMTQPSLCDPRAPRRAPRPALALLPALLLCLATSCGEPAPALGLICLPQDVVGTGPWEPEELLDFQSRESHGPQRSRLAEFGRVSVGDPLTHTFRLVNADPTPMRLKRVSPSCTCTVPRVRWTAPDGSTGEGSMSSPGEIALIPAGAVLEIEARVTPSRVQRKNTDKLVTVNLLTDSPRTPSIGLELHLVVEDPFRLVPDPFDLGRVPASGGGHAELIVLQHEDAESLHTISELAPLPDGILASLREEPLDQGRRRWAISVEMLPPLDPGRVVRNFHAHTLGPDGEPGPDLRLLVSALVVADIDVHPHTAVVWPGKPAEVILTANLPGNHVGVVETRIEGDSAEALEVIASSHEPRMEGRSSRWTLTLRMAGEPEQPITRGKVIVVLDDPQTPQLEFNYVCHAAPPSR